MRPTTSRSPLRALACLLPLLCAAASSCGTPGSSESVDPAPPEKGAERAPHPESPTETGTDWQPAPWTEDFMGKAVLLAERIRIEGPPGLREHTALRADDELYVRTVQTTPQGFLQVVRPRDPQASRAAATCLVRGQLDAWQLSAFAEITLLERPGPCPIVVVAEGEAFWQDVDGLEQRGERLEFRGEVEE